MLRRDDSASDSDSEPPGKRGKSKSGRRGFFDLFGGRGEKHGDAAGSRQRSGADVLGELASLSIADGGRQSAATGAAAASAATTAATADAGAASEGTLKHWKPKYTLRNHLDAVRSVAFHDTDALLLSASEDGTAKLWSLSAATASPNSRGCVTQCCADAAG